MIVFFPDAYKLFHIFDFFLRQLTFLIYKIYNLCNALKKKDELDYILRLNFQYINLFNKNLKTD